MSILQTKRSVLVVDDQDAVRDVICRSLVKRGYDVVAASSGTDALAKAEQRAFDVFLLDIRMPGMNGLEVLRRIRMEHPDAVVIMLTAVDDKESKIQSTAMGIGAFAYLTKPCKLKDLEDTIRSAFRQEEDFWEQL